MKNATAFVLGGKIYSDKVTLNGAPLRLNSDGSLPSVEGVPVVGNALVVPPQTIAWLELGGDARDCD